MAPTSIAMQAIAFDPANAKTALGELPCRRAVFALYGGQAHSQPYIGRTANLHTRLERLLQPSAKHPRRLQLAGLVGRIEWRLTGSEFESLLVQFELLQGVYGTKALERMHLRPPAFVRYLGSNAYPRIVVTNRPGQREADWAYGPFASRAAAERFADEALKLFLLRRCTDDLHPDPSFPGCVYSEMKMCLAPCFKGCSDERYAEEAAAVKEFLATRGQSRLVSLSAERDRASESLQFETAAALHAQVQKVENVRSLAPELVQPMSHLRALIVQISANPDEVALFLYENGRLRGPTAFSTLGMRIHNERSGSSSLFAHPVAIEPIPEESANAVQKSEIRDPLLALGDCALPLTPAPGQGRASIRPPSPHQGAPASAPARKAPRGALEERFETILAQLANLSLPPNGAIRQGHLALLKQWYYRPEARRPGEIFFPNADGRWPVKSILRGIGRVFAAGFRTG